MIWNVKNIDFLKFKKPASGGLNTQQGKSIKLTPPILVHDLAEKGGVLYGPPEILL